MSVFGEDDYDDDIDLGPADDDDDVIVPDDYEDDDDDDDAYDDDDDDYEDASDDDIDFVVGLYREDGLPVAVNLSSAAANDLDELIEQLRRLPGDAGAIGVVSIDHDFFVLCRARGRNVQVLLNDSTAAADWPIARDVADYLGIDVPDHDDDSEVWGDLDMLADAGLSELDLEAIASDDDDADELVRQIVDKMKFTTPFDRAVALNQ